MEDQLSIRVPRTLARLLARRARERGVRRSQIVREALERYLAGDTDAGGTGALPTWERISPFIGAIELDRAAIDRDALTRRIRRHNWRE